MHNIRGLAARRIARLPVIEQGTSKLDISRRRLDGR